MPGDFQDSFFLLGKLLLFLGRIFGFVLVGGHDARLLVGLREDAAVLWLRRLRTVHTLLER